MTRLTAHFSGFPLFALAFLCGCVGTLPRVENASSNHPLPAQIGDQFCYAAPRVDASIELLDEKKHFDFFRGGFASGIPGDDDPSEITFEWYQPRGVDHAPVIVVLPILNGQKNIVRPFATYFAKQGYASIIVDSRQRTTLTADIIEPQVAIRQAVKRHRRILDWVESEPTLDADRIAVFGASLGGFNAFFLAAADDRVQAVAPALVAADLPYVFANSNERRIANAFAEAMTELELDRAGLEARMREKIETDTSTLAPYVDADRILMILARRDKAVPFAKQEELRALIGEPEAVVLPTGHITAAAYIFYLRRKVLEFFDSVFTQPAASVASISPASCLNTQAPRIMSGWNQERPQGTGEKHGRSGRPF